MKSDQKLTRTFIKRAWLNASGRWQFFRGRSCQSFELSYESFHHLLDLNPRSYTAHFYLGQIARARGHARLAFDHYLAAYRSSIGAFNRSRLPDDLKNHIALRHGLSRSKPMVFHELGQQASSTLGRRELEHSDGPELGRHPDFEIHLPEGHELVESDSMSLEEAQRFEDLEPITKEDIQSVDLDRLISQLMADE